ncbi:MULTISPECIES: hypothetical protein [Fusobacterium]|jgi:hypothetical protein|uniref:hypothetical protein n=1 Tax=Fusobacterium TaxID=848 RepID=UPI0015A5B2E9|nr:MULTISPECIES: hypothetical protein [Fusobacterium]MCF2613048.1 hypothetical protein [Fusobacterium perfoetens]MDY2980472.1 hypothetical protein [Fusobacterium sp.]
MKEETNLTKEFESYKNYILSLPKEDIFKRAFEINFYTEVYNYLKYLPPEDVEKYRIKELYMWELFNFFIDCEEYNYSINDSNGILKLVDDFNKLKG